MKVKSLVSKIDWPPAGTYVVAVSGGADSVALLREGFFEKALAFEPAPRNFRLLRKNAAQNGLIRVLQELQLSGSDQRPQVIVKRCIWRFDGLGVERCAPGPATLASRKLGRDLPVN